MPNFSTFDEYIPRFTYKEYVEWEGRWELINGIIYPWNHRPGIKHQQILAKIMFELAKIIEKCNDYETIHSVDWKINEHNVVCPDNMVISTVDTEAKYLTKTPQIIFEILSVSTTFKDRNVKYKLYEKMGVKYYILVDGAALTAEVFELIGDEYQKIKNAQDDVVNLMLESCELEFDFSKIWD